MLSVYGYQSFQHYHKGKSLFIHLPKPGMSTAECLLQILRENGEYSALEAKILDLALVLHAEHGGGQQFHVYRTRRDFFGNGYLFGDRGGARLAERSPARRARISKSCRCSTT